MALHDKTHAFYHVISICCASKVISTLHHGLCFYHASATAITMKNYQQKTGRKIAQIAQTGRNIENRNLANCALINKLAPCT